jgi:uncharacterized membrane protein
MMKAITAALALYSYYLIQSSLPHLPSRIPTHFNFAGQPDGWGRPNTLWMLLAIQVVSSVLILTIPLWGRRFPQIVNLGFKRLSDYTPQQRERVMPLLAKMSEMMSIVFGLLFTYLIREMIQAALTPHPSLRMQGVLVLFIAAMIGLTVYYIRRINAAAKATPSNTMSRDL